MLQRWEGNESKQMPRLDTTSARPLPPPPARRDASGRPWLVAIASPLLLLSCFPLRCCALLSRSHCAHDLCGWAMRRTGHNRHIVFFFFSVFMRPPEHTNPFLGERTCMRFGGSFTSQGSPIAFPPPPLNDQRNRRGEGGQGWWSWDWRRGRKNSLSSSPSSYYLFPLHFAFLSGVCALPPPPLPPFFEGLQGESEKSAHA